MVVEGAWLVEVFWFLYDTHGKVQSSFSFMKVCFLSAGNIFNFNMHVGHVRRALKGWGGGEVFMAFLL